MLSLGKFRLKVTHTFLEGTLKRKKNSLDFEIYTIICSAPVVEDRFSSEVFSI